MARGPLTYYVEPGRVTAWLSRAPARAGLTYAIGPNLEGGGHATAVLARRLAEEGRATLTTSRNRDRAGCTNYILVKKEQDAAGLLLAADPRAAMPPPGGAEAEVYALLREIAAAGGACPTNDAIADTLGLPDHEAARYRFNRLVRAGHVRVIEPNRFGRRVIEIAATGERTKPA